MLNFLLTRLLSMAYALSRFSLKSKNDTENEYAPFSAELLLIPAKVP
jgi:hypothetical protein